jgi:ATP-grasp domain
MCSRAQNHRAGPPVKHSKRGGLRRQGGRGSTDGMSGSLAALLRVPQLVVDCPPIKELDIKPLLADETGVIALMKATMSCHSLYRSPTDKNVSGIMAVASITSLMS